MFFQFVTHLHFDIETDIATHGNKTFDTWWALRLNIEKLKWICFVEQSCQSLDESENRFVGQFFFLSPSSKVSQTEKKYNGIKLQVLCYFKKLKEERGDVVYNSFFCGNWSSNHAPTWRHFTSSLKKEDVGYCGKLSRVRESCLLVKRAGGKKIFAEKCKRLWCSEQFHLVHELSPTTWSKESWTLVQEKVHPQVYIWWEYNGSESSIPDSFTRKITST